MTGEQGIQNDQTTLQPEASCLRMKSTHLNGVLAIFTPIDISPSCSKYHLGLTFILKSFLFSERITESWLVFIFSLLGKLFIRIPDNDKSEIIPREGAIPSETTIERVLILMRESFLLSMSGLS